MSDDGLPDDPRPDGELRAARAKAGELAGELKSLTDERPSITWTPGGAVRVSVRVRGAHSRALVTAVLRVLSLADRFGHRKTQGWEYLWLEVGGVPGNDEEWQ
ncbi:hypothetical protein ACIQBJ_33245 [Kitasatospora sp. NPDC088391]|uniref:hypothetical protein n=1 Tax=Kitasatospora sp. NPDC088391 TaxID=3364074 RepID=UPI00382DB7CA